MVANEFRDVHPNSNVDKVNGDNSGLHQQWMRIAQAPQPTNSETDVINKAFSRDLEALKDKFSSEPNKEAAMSTFAPKFNALLTAADHRFSDAFDRSKPILPDYWHKQCEVHAMNKVAAADLQKLSESDRALARYAYSDYLSKYDSLQQQGEAKLKQFPDLYHDAQLAKKAAGEVSAIEHANLPVFQELADAKFLRLKIRSIFSDALAESGPKYKDQAQDMNEQAKIMISKMYINPVGVPCKDLESQGWKPDWSKTPEP